MKMFAKYKGKKFISLALGATVALTAVAVRNVPSLEVMATSQTSQTSESSEPAEESPANKAYNWEKGEYKMYYWKKVKNGDYPNKTSDEGVEKRALFITSYWDSDEEEAYKDKGTNHIFCPVAPYDVWIGDSYGSSYKAKLAGDVHKDINIKQKKDVGKFNDSNVSEDHSAWLYSPKTVSGSDWIDISADAFYTPTDENAVFISYRGNSDDEHYGIFRNNERAGIFDIRLADIDSQRDYYISGDTYNGLGSEGELYVHNDPVGHNNSERPVIAQTEDATDMDKDEKTQDDKWRIYFGDYSYLACTNFGYWYANQCENTRGFDLVWYIGEEQTYSAFSSNATLKKEVLSITAGDYIDNKGGKTSTSGVFINPGVTLTIKKGAVVSVSGKIINEGSIVIEKGGTLLIKDGGAIAPYMAQGDIPTIGCGTIKCGGDIIIQKGGALVAGMANSNSAVVPFYLDEGATLINQGTPVYGSARIGKNVRIELHENSVTYGGYYPFDESLEVKESDTESDADATKNRMSKMGYTPIYQRKISNKYVAVYEKRNRIKSFDMLANQVSYFAEKNPSDCSLLKSAYSTKAKDYVSDLKFGMYAADKVSKTDYAIKKSSSAVFEDKFALESGQITTRDLTL